MGAEASAEQRLRGLNAAFSNYEEAKRLLGEAERDFIRALEGNVLQERAKAWEHLHLTQRFLHATPIYFSQSGQDRILDFFFLGKTDGVFVDVGGYDGITGSNTLFFEIYRNWQGICIEPSLSQYRQAAGFRKARCLNTAIGSHEGSADFLEITSGYTQMSGLSATYNPAMLEVVRSNPNHRETLHAIPIRTLEDVLETEGISAVDLISLDIEGGEIAVLETFPFDRIRVTAWSIENMQHGERLRDLMIGKGYQLFEMAGMDEIFVRTDAV